MDIENAVAIASVEYECCTGVVGGAIFDVLEFRCPCWWLKNNDIWLNEKGVNLQVVEDDFQLETLRW